MSEDKVPPQLMTIESSLIGEIAFDETDNSLYVRFKKNGLLYVYLGVPRDVYEYVLSTPSHGRAFNEVVRDQYIYRRLE